jgi:hypothetical protein
MLGRPLRRQWHLSGAENYADLLSLKFSALCLRKAMCDFSALVEGLGFQT